MSSQDDLAQHWVHSHEEDTASELVYRPAAYKFPPSRGRTALDLHPDGTFVGADIGADDRPNSNTGTWTLTDDEQLVLTTHDHDRPTRTVKIASVTPDRLALRP